MIWKNSKHYNTPARLVVLMREICNALIAQARNYVSGEDIFTLIEQEEAGRAVEQLKTTLKVCGTFKSTYFDYKATANAECPTNPWRIQNNALFMRLDSFLERCHDILDLTQTIVQFSKLAKIEIGGTKGKTLTTSVNQIYTDFSDAVKQFQDVNYDIMDVGAKQFDDDFYEFRCRIKELERRLGSVLTQGFDDCSTIYGRFKLLDSFEGLLDRPIIQDELEKKHIALVQAYGMDLKVVQELFLTQRDDPPIASNLPPYSGAITWCRGLMERITEPMDKLKQLNRTIMDREEAKEVAKVYQNILSNLMEYMDDNFNQWAVTVECSSKQKLRMPLLKRANNLLSVNFDPALVALLREVKYFLLLDLNEAGGDGEQPWKQQFVTPEAAMSIYKKAEVFRRETGNLDLIVNMYNSMMTSLLPVEAPLVQSHLDKIDKTIQRGIGQMNWNSHGIDLFITESMTAVKTANNVLQTLKSNLSSVEEILRMWREDPSSQQPKFLLLRQNKPVSRDEFEAARKSHTKVRYSEIQDGGKQIAGLVKDSNKVLKVSQGLPHWKAYVDFINNIVVDGLAQLIHESLAHLSDQVNPAVIKEQDKSPMLEISLDLYASNVLFRPDVLEASGGDGIRDTVNTWIKDIFQVAGLFKRLDVPEGSYIKEMQENMEVAGQLAAINDSLSMNEEECLKFKHEYEKYKYLWATDIATAFATFVDNARKEGPGGLVLYDLPAFDQEITKYHDVLAEITALKPMTDIGWLRINSQPIKQALSTWVTKWTYQYTEFLHHHVVNELRNLNNFIRVTNEGLDAEVADNDNAALMGVMSHIRNVRKKMDSMSEMFAPLRDIVQMLKGHGSQVEGLIGELSVQEYLESAPLKWDALVNKTFRKKEEILPLQNAEVENIKAKLEEFFLSMREFRNDFRKNAPWDLANLTRKVQALDKDKGGSGGEKVLSTEIAGFAYREIDAYYKKMMEKQSGVAHFNELEELFELPVSKYNEINETGHELVLLKRLWDFQFMVASTFDDWQGITWADAGGLLDDLEYRTRALSKQIKILGNSPGNAIMKGWGVYKFIEASVKNMSVVLPLISDLRSPAMRDRHWKSLLTACRAAGKVDVRGQNFNLGDLIGLQLHLHVDDVAEVVETANKELKIENKLLNIEEAWTGMTLEYVQHKDQEGMFVVKPPDIVVESLEAHQLELQTMIGMGKFVAYFGDRVHQWQQKLGNVESTLREWMSVSKQWASLEAIFLGSKDIRAQLPDDTKRFESIDQDFKDLMKEQVNRPNVIEACTGSEGLFDQLCGMTANLELCQKSLNEYLDMKKKVFPRFYFVSNVALLDILSNGNNPPKIMPYVSDCYDALHTLVFVEGTAEDVFETNTMVASDGERVPFPESIGNFRIEGAVEDWLNQLTSKMKDCLAHVLDTGIESAVNWEVEKPRHLWLFDYPAQVVLTATQNAWTEEAEKALEEYECGQDDAVRNYLGLCNERLNNLIKLVQGSLEKPDRTKIISLITMDVHSRDVVDKLVKEKTEGPTKFLWQQQLRYYWEPSQKAVNIRICDFNTLYSYEYIGNCGRLVITPLTDRCYITLTTALRLMLGGAPAGPAGTGKTETTKDLARALALPCYVFNCSDQMNFQTLGDIFKGLSQTGAWGCFDEFNRIPIEVLSVVATQVKTILDAIVHNSVPSNREAEFQDLPPGQPPCKVGNYNFMGDSIALVPTTGFFITMNPGYAGRTELPENLKALFRSCAMIRPDLALICENMLMAEGFTKARVLSIKFVTLYTLSDKLLSPQAHYDWGLRAVKSVLRVAGMLKRQNPELDEEPVLMRALRDFNTPKIPLQDSPIFLRLISDLFPKYADTPTVIDEELREMTVHCCKEQGLQHDDGFVLKVVQFQELLDVRHSVMLIGPAGCGKTAIWQTLASTHNHYPLDAAKCGASEEPGARKPKKTCVCETVNPKAVTSDELYGYMTLAKDWKDGVLSIVMRGMSKNYRDFGFYDYQTYKWVVLDGDVDAVWIESMNTVMDDNKVLTLVSNERVPLSDAMRMVFEINSLKNATPATVSRAGILFINETDIGWRPFVESWIQAKEEESIKAKLPGLVDKYVEKIIDGTRKMATVTPIRVIACVQTFCNLLDGLLGGIPPEEVGSGVLEHCAVYALMWAFGGPLNVNKQTDFRKEFSLFMTSTFPDVKFPGEGLIFDYYFDFDEYSQLGEASDKYQMSHWKPMVPEYTPVSIGTGPAEQPFKSLVVPTVDSVRLTDLLKYFVGQDKHVMLVGTAGTGKTTVVKDYLGNLDENSLFNIINMNYYTDSAALQSQIEANIEKRSGKMFGPPATKKMVFFIDDINLPYVEEYGTQNSLSLLRQHLSYGSFYDRGDLGFKKEVVDVVYVAAMNPTAGSFFINERCQRYFATFSCTMPTIADLTTIYHSILDGHLNCFRNGIDALAAPLVDATIRVQNIMSEKFLPSAVKFVYNWNMRELSNVFQGICAAKSDYYIKQPSVVRLWLHECYRVYGDRLVNQTDIERFDGELKQTCKQCFADVADPEELEALPNVFTSFASPVASGDPAYLPVADSTQLKKVLEEKLAEYNESFAIMDLVLFEQAMEHVTRIARIIEHPAGNAMLIGVGGSGKQSLSRLAAFICGFQVKQLSVTGTFSVIDLKEALKEFYTAAGVKGVPTVWLMTDGQIVNEAFLVYINDVLASGWVPDLFAGDELDGIFSALRNEAKQAGIPDTRDNMTDFFVQRVRKNLHVVLCFSPVGDLFRIRARRFPGLINATSIDWFHAWPRDALVNVAQRYLGSEDVEIPAEVKENISYHMAEVHLSVVAQSAHYLSSQRRYNYVTPKSFLELIGFYKHLLGEKKRLVGEQIKRLDTGLSTLRKTAQDVAELQIDLNHTMVKVEEKKKATDNLLEQMGKQRAEAEEQQEKAAVEQEKAEQASSEAARIETEAAAELAQAEPAMQAAKGAVDCLNKAALTELKSMSKPPSGVDKVTKCCLMMIEKEYKNFKWDRAKKMMAKVDAFLQKLKDYRGQDMTEELIAKLTPVVGLPEMDYQSMLKKSFAAANLCSWVLNIYKFNRIYVKVKPLMDSLEAARATKAAAEKKLEGVQALVAEVQSRLADLRSTLLEATEEKAKVEAEAEACLARLGLAERLVGGLASENERWGLEIERLQTSETLLTGDTLIAASFVSYVGAFDGPNRLKLWSDVWLNDVAEREIPISEGSDPLHMLTTDGNNAQMMSEGLPADRISIENGAIITNAKRWPLIIDPQLQGIKWLRRRYEPKEEEPSLADGDADDEANTDDVEANPAGGFSGGPQLVVMQLTGKSWLRNIKNAITNGDVVIIENLGESIDATMEPVLSRAIYKKGRTLQLKLGGEEIEYDPRFKLFLITKLSNPHYKPEIAAQCTLVNFIATESGLEDQLLERVVKAEKPKLEEEKQALQKAFNDYKIQLLKLEDELLERLANAPDDILSDVPLIEKLEATKATAAEIALAVEKAKETEILINQSREVFRPVASEAAMLYFLLTQLYAIDHMYQYSLDAFVQFFNKAIADAPWPSNEKDVAARIESLVATLRLTIYKWVSRGLFERHKVILLAQLTFRLMSRGSLKEELDPKLFSFLLRGPKNMSEENPVDWLPNASWFSVQALGTLDEFAKLPADLVEAAPRFKEWYNHVTPESEKLPLDWAGLDKTPFLKLLVLRSLRADRMTVAITKFVRNTLPAGADYVDCDSTMNSYGVLKSAHADSTPETPIYFILSPGADVVADVDKLAAENGKEKGVSYHNVSMGQGQDVIAMNYLDVAHRQGHWVILNNVHLMPRWLVQLEEQLDVYNQEGNHPTFRVFLSSDPSKSIPIGILSRSIKLTNEPPAGLRANLKRAWCSFSEAFINECESKTKAILFGLCYFHSVMMERKKFGPKGFNMMYPFSLGDLRDSAVCLNNYMESSGGGSKIPWEDLQYIFGQIVYGGHIVNDFDRLLCVTYLKYFMRDELLDEGMELFPFSEDDRKVTFQTISPSNHKGYLEHVDVNLTTDTPIAFGLHPNAEIGFRTTQSENLFKVLAELQPRESGGEEGTSPQHIAENALNDIQDRFGEKGFDVAEINEMLEEKGPFQNVFLQECDAVNRLLVEMSRSLKELNLGFAGELTMSDKMEDLQTALFLERVPARWSSLAWPSLRSLGAWLHDLSARIAQLEMWVEDPMSIPKVTWISGLVNPQSFLTAIKQMTAQRSGAELDKLIIMTDVTKRNIDDCDSPSRDGAYIHGLSLQGARWDVGATLVEKSRPKEMFCRMPVINCKSVSIDKQSDSGVFFCPCYKTEQRGPTYVFSAQLKTKSPADRWIMAGVALIMDIVE